MKLINKKKGFTLVELIVSIFISSILFFIVFTFITDSIETLTFSHKKTRTITDIFSFRSNFNRIIKGGYMKVKKIGETKNTILMLNNVDSTEGYIFGIVDKNTGKLQKDYIYGENFIGYRKVSELEIKNINSSGEKVFDLKFFQDKIYDGVNIKDFFVDFYNSGSILDINISGIINPTESFYGKSFTGIILDKKNIIEFNLNF